jgi:DnaB-like helicase N terminal domain/DnaB-like helicase C terminal domain
MSLYNIDLEKRLLAGLLQYSETWGEVSFMKEEDFSPVHRAVFSVLKLTFERNEPISAILLAEKLKTFSITFEDIQPLDYLQALQSPLIMVKKDEIAQIGKEIKKQTVIRDLSGKCDQLKEWLKGAQTKPFNEITGKVDKTLSDIDKSYYKTQEIPLFETLIDNVEERGNNPINVEDLGFLGPFPSINETCGSICYPSSYVLVGSRTSGGKSAFGFYYNVYIAEKYHLPLLHLDAAEMTVEQLQTRAVCCLSRGQIPLWAVKSGEWRKNPEWVELVRGDIWPRVKKIKIYYQNVGSFTPQETISFIKRFYYRHCEKGSHLLIHDDYQKGLETYGKNISEWQAVGYKAGAIKTLITEDIIASYWTSVQNNRSGVYNGKNVREIQDSESVMGLSDRLLQQATTGFLMRFKVPEELAHENNLFGNVRLMPVKERELLGRHFEKNLLPVKLADGRFVRNYFNLNMHNFYYEDKGSLRDMIDALGEGVIDINQTDKEDKETVV